MQNFKLNVSGGVFALVVIGVFLVLHIVFTVCVWKDADRLHYQGRSTVILPAFIWGLTTLFFGLPALALYWAVHHSRLARRGP